MIKSFKVLKCHINDVKDFVEYWHYSKNVNGISWKYCFKLMNENVLIGASIFGNMAIANTWKKYIDNEKDILELRRLCCIDDTPKNTESYFIGKCLRWLKKNTDIKKIISYADKTYGHEGIIYKASNFKLIGKTDPCKCIEYNGKLYHSRSLNTKYNGKYKPFALELRNAVKNNNVKMIDSLEKNVYIYDLNGEFSKNNKFFKLC
jgi:hypothetical protein